MNRLGDAVIAAAAVALAAAGPPVAAQQNDAELAAKLSNPVAAMISVPFQFNWDEDFGPGREGHRLLMNLQPVVPIKLNDEWTLISRTIVPVIDQDIPFIGDGSQSGVGDITQSLFFSPSKPGPGGIIWGVGPAFVIPSGVDYLSGKQWGAGPTAVVLEQDGPWTVGMLANHLWGFAGSGPKFSNTFLQPFAAYNTPDAWTFTLQAETSYDWRAGQWTVPVHAIASKLVRIGTQPVSFGVGARYYADSPDGGPHGWGVRAVVTLLFPT